MPAQADAEGVSCCIGAEAEVRVFRLLLGTGVLAYRLLALHPHLGLPIGAGCLAVVDDCSDFVYPPPPLAPL